MNLSKRLLSTGLSLSLLFSGATCSCVEKKPSAWSQTPRAVKSAVVGLGVGASGLLLACCYYRNDRDWYEQRWIRTVGDYAASLAREGGYERELCKARRELENANDELQRLRIRIQDEENRDAARDIEHNRQLRQEQQARTRAENELTQARRARNLARDERDEAQQARDAAERRAAELQARIADLQQAQDDEGRMYAMQLALTERMLGNVGDAEARRNLRLCEQYLTAKLDLHYTPEAERSPEKVAHMRDLEVALNELRGGIANIDDDKAAGRKDLIQCTVNSSYYLPVDVQYCGVFCDDGSVHAVSTQAAVDNAQNPRSYALDRCPCCRIPTHYFVPEAH